MPDSSNMGSGYQGWWTRFLALFNKGKDEVVRSSHVSKTRLDLYSLKKERERVFERLGEEVYKKHKNNILPLSGLDSFFTEIDIINLKLSSKERELKNLTGENAEIIQPGQTRHNVRPEKRTYHRERNRERKGTSSVKEDKKETVLSPEKSAEAVKTKGPISDKRPRKRYYKPKGKFEVKNDVKVEGSNKMGL